MSADTENTGGGGQQACGFYAIVGAPNAGKSTLVNALVGSKVSIVSRKAQTTRFQVRGLVVAGDTQLVLVDTPGIFAPKRRLDRAMVEAAYAGTADADAIVLIVDVGKGADGAPEEILKRLGAVATKRVLVLNKVDKLRDKTELLPLSQRLSEAFKPDRTFMISALSGSGLEALKDYLVEIAPKGPWHYPADELSDLSERMLAAEITREKVYDRLHDELPYAAHVETTAWEERRDGSVRIEQTITLERDSQRKIALGAKGETVKRISMDAREELAKLLERPVHLFLTVKVAENWSDDPEVYRHLGLDFPKG